MAVNVRKISSSVNGFGFPFRSASTRSLIIPSAQPSLAEQSYAAFANVTYNFTERFDLSVGVQQYRDPAKWRVTSEPWGFVDYEHDRIPDPVDAG